LRKRKERERKEHEALGPYFFCDSSHSKTGDFSPSGDR
jgi:hypothetical protein